MLETDDMNEDKLSMADSALRINVEALSSEHYSLLHITSLQNGEFEGIVELDTDGGLMVISKKWIIQANVCQRRLLYVSDTSIRDILHNQTLDLTDEGERWEGDILNETPFGWGVLYDKEGEQIYYGFRIGCLNVCFGRSYYSDINKLEYEGQWMNGMRWGKGILYDRNGKVVYEGEWMNDAAFTLNRVEVILPESEVIHNRIQDLVVSNYSCNENVWRELDLCPLSNLHSLKIGDSCFQYVQKLILQGLHLLETVTVGYRSFSTSPFSPWKGKGAFICRSNSSLRSLEIDRCSFTSFDSFVLAG